MAPNASGVTHLMHRAIKTKILSMVSELLALCVAPHSKHICRGVTWMYEKYTIAKWQYGIVSVVVFMHKETRSCRGDLGRLPFLYFH